MIKLTDTMVEAIVTLALVITGGLLIILLLKVWDWVFTCVLEMLNLKKEFIQFVYDKYHKQKVVTAKTGDTQFTEEDES